MNKFYKNILTSELAELNYTPVDKYSCSIIDIKTIYDTLERLEFKTVKEKKEYTEKLVENFARKLVVNPGDLLTDLILYSKEQAANSA